jgi:hypothetical protein
MAELIYSYDIADAAMCIWEEMVSPSLNLEPWKDYKEQGGAAGLRDVVLTKLASACHDAWCRALERYEKTEEGHTDDCEAGGGTGVCTCNMAERNDPGAFDWEFVPFWLTNCVDWSGEHPRVRGGVGVNAGTIAEIEEMA